MMKVIAEGSLRKMRGVKSQLVNYAFCFAEQENIEVNQFIGKSIGIQFLGKIHCVQCGRKTAKSFQQGHCFPCMRKINECGNCRLFPERCQVEQGTCPTDDWAHSQCHGAHVVYLANSSNLKVGITREKNPCTRWIDQGAMQALPILKTSNRYQSGLVEVLLKQHVGDRTNWRTMLKRDCEPLDLLQEKDRIFSLAGESLRELLVRYDGQITMIEEAETVSLHYPVTCYPDKIKSLSLDKTPEVKGVLQGIKGQYLLLDVGVINIRKFSGYEVTLSVEE
jgi:hypothetical protein